MSRPGDGLAASVDAVPRLRVEGLTVRYPVRRDPPLEALAGVDVTLGRGGSLGVLGESGCGKTTLLSALAGLLPETAEVEGTVRLGGRRLAVSSPGADRRAGEDAIGMVFQEASLALHPMLRVGRQIGDVLRARRRLSGRALDAEVHARLVEVGLDEDAIARAFPHQLSGGQQQRVVLARALACDPSVLLADEPTASLDTVTAKRVLDTIRRLVDRRGVALLVVSHDPAVLARVADTLLVLVAGRPAEHGPTRAVLGRPRHPLSAALLDSRIDRLRGVPSQGILAPPPARAAVEGCRFAGRCPLVEPGCHDRVPGAHRPEPGRTVWCQVLEDAPDREPR